MEKVASSQRSRWLIFIALLGLFVFGAPRISFEISWWLAAWRTDPRYSHGWLVLFLSFGFFLFEVVRGRTRKERVWSFWPAVPWAIAAVFFVLLGKFTQNHFSFVTGLLMTLPVLFSLLSSSGERAVRFPLFLLLLTVPLPFLSEITGLLQVLVTVSASKFLAALGIAVEHQGTVVHIPGGSFRIGTGCSGVNSLISLATVSAIGIYFLRDVLPLKVILFLCVIPVSIAANLSRVIMILIAGHLWGVDFAVDLWHDFAGGLFYTGSLLGLVALWSLMRKFAFPLRQTPA